MMEFCPLLLSCNTCGSVWDMDLIVARFVAFAWKVDELQDKWTTSDDATSSRQEISANDVFQH